MASRWPQHGDGNRNEQHANPHGEVITSAPRQHQPAQRQEDQRVGDQMAEARVAERCGQDSPQRQPGPHRQIPLTTPEQLIDQFLSPGETQQQQRNQPAATHLQQAGITMMTPMGWVG